MHEQSMALALHMVKEALKKITGDDNRYFEEIIGDICQYFTYFLVSFLFR